MSDRTLVEYMPQVPDNASEPKFAIWLVPARNNIQREMLRLSLILQNPILFLEKKKLNAERRDPPIVTWLIGTAFSLWRAVFQARKQLEGEDTTGPGGDFLLTRLIYNNAASYGDENNAWSFGYYINNARFRLVSIRREAIELEIWNDEKLAHEFETLERALKEGIPETRCKAWERCFCILHEMINTLEAKQRSASKKKEPRKASKKK